MSVFILGISFGYHDSSACLLKDEDILAAVQEERFSRIKNDRSFPIKSIVYVLTQANINILELDAIVFYEDPALKLGRQLRSAFQGNILSSINSCKKVFKTVLSGSYTKYDIASLFYSYGLIQAVPLRIFRLKFYLVSIIIPMRRPHFTLPLSPKRQFYALMG